MKKKAISLLLSAAIAMSSASALLTNNVKADGDSINGAESFVRRLYSTILGREPDADGLANWVELMQSGKVTGVYAASGFILSDEFQSREMSNEEYVSSMYAAFLGREPSKGDLEYWAGLMANGTPKEAIYTGFANSQEFFDICAGNGIVAGTAYVGADPYQVSNINLYADRLYDVILGRDCDRDGMDYWTQSLLQGYVTGASAADGFIFSDEYLLFDKSDAEFVTDVYESLMGRTPASEELDYWLGLIGNGTNDRVIFNAFVGSAEFTAICDSYGIVRGNPTAEGRVSARPSNGGVVNVWSWNEEFVSIIDEYASTEGVVIKSTTIDSTSYQSSLDAALASGENAPDLFATDIDYTHKYVNSDNTIALSELGITSADTAQMFPYTISIGSDDAGTLKALTWQVCPSVVIYNRTVAQATLGVSEPADVQPYFATWDAFLNTSTIVAGNESGNYRAVSGVGDISRSVLAGRGDWIVNGQVQLDSYAQNYINIANVLIGEELTFGTTQWFAEWYEGMENETVLSYWGPMWFYKYCMGLYNEDSNPTYGDWGVVNAPNNSFWGGTFILASKYCDNKTEVANIMRTLCSNAEVQTSMAMNGEFVNNDAVMASLATNPALNDAALGGQNPIPYLLNCARNIVYSPAIENYSETNAFTDTVAEFIRDGRDWTEFNQAFLDAYDYSVNPRIVWRDGNNSLSFYSDSTFSSSVNKFPAGMEAFYVSYHNFRSPEFDSVEAMNAFTSTFDFTLCRYRVELIAPDGTVTTQNVDSTIELSSGSGYREDYYSDGYNSGVAPNDPGYEYYFVDIDENLNFIISPVASGAIPAGTYTLNLYEIAGSLVSSYTLVID